MARLIERKKNLSRFCAARRWESKGNILTKMWIPDSFHVCCICFKNVINMAKHWIKSIGRFLLSICHSGLNILCIKINKFWVSNKHLYSSRCFIRYSFIYVSMFPKRSPAQYIFARNLCGMLMIWVSIKYTQYPYQGKKTLNCKNSPRKTVSKYEGYLKALFILLWRLA